jgi:hypothetical protein
MYSNVLSPDLNNVIITIQLKEDGVGHEQHQKEQEGKKYTVVVSSNAICYPRTMVIIDTNTGITDLAMS